MYIGIDLGTTNSAVVGNKGSELKIYKTADGADTLPSVIYIDKRGHRLYGKRAYDQGLLSPENVASGFKRLMGTSTMLDLKTAEIALSPEECSAEILKILIGQAFTESGSDEVTGTVITIPAAFNQMQSEATLRAAGIAGISSVALLQEPIAAAMAAMAHIKNKNGQFLVYDLGGGTFDLALVQGIAGSVNVIAHEGINMLGGRDFDRAIVSSYVRPWLLNKFSLPEDFQKQPKYARLMGIARLAAEKAKIELSTSEMEIIFASDEEVRLQDESGNDIYLEIELKRTDVEEIIKDDITKTIDLTQKMLKDSGYTNKDIDRVVFVGGPTKMPYIRNRVPGELGIPADLQVDPMTAVALGAAIYAESREWNGIETKRKASRASGNISDNFIKYDYPTRSSDEKAKIRIRLEENAEARLFELQIDSSAGWTSGRKTIESDSTIEVPLSNIGNNNFRIMIFDSTGKPVKDASKEFSISRTFASSTGVPATQTISVKIRESAESVKNVLQPIITKGTSLPAKGEQRFRAARDLKAGNADETLNFELYQDEGAQEPELNLGIGAFRIRGDDLESGMKIREGDEIVFNWEMSDSGLFKATVDLPSVGQTFDTPKFYVDQAGHKSFDLEGGAKIAKRILEDTQEELNTLFEITGQQSSEQIERIKKDLEKQKEILENAADGDTTRSVTESSRHIRQAISKVRHAPENRTKVLTRELLEIREGFNDHAREFLDEKSNEIFDLNDKHAVECLERGSEKDVKDAQSHINAMGSIFHKGIWQNPEFLIDRLKARASSAHLSSDTKKHDDLVQLGVEAIKSEDFDQLRRILFQLNDLQISVGGMSSPLDKLSSIMRA